MMWPSIIFDKSTLQSLSVDESVWLDQFYLNNVTPIFFIETLADLEKEVRTWRKPEDVVWMLAYKTPEMGCVNSAHWILIQDELSWAQINMSFRPCPNWGKVVQLEWWLGFVVVESDEQEAFKRWHQWDFLDVERSFAKRWRRSLAQTSANTPDNLLSDVLGTYYKPRDISELKAHITTLMDNCEDESWLSLCMDISGIDANTLLMARSRWLSAKYKSLSKFSPYFSYVATVNLVFRIGSALWFFESFKHKETHHVDLAYLYYLPFVNIFVSHDNFHKWVVPFFLHEEQTFISGEDFKAELTKLNTHYASFPQAVKDGWITSFALFPPASDDFLTSRMWNKYMRSDWRELGKSNRANESGTELIDRINARFQSASDAPAITMPMWTEPNELFVAQKVRYEKWSWKRFPPEVLKNGSG